MSITLSWKAFLKDKIGLTVFAFLVFVSGKEKYACQILEYGRKVGTGHQNEFIFYHLIKVTEDQQVGSVGKGLAAKSDNPSVIPSQT